MRKNFTLKYITILLLFTISYNYSKAQIIYTDVIDTTILRSSTNAGTLTNTIDINNDGIFDYNLAVRAQIVNPVGCTINPASQTNLFAWIGTTASYSNTVGDYAGSVASINFDTLIGPASGLIWNTSSLDYLYNLTYTYPSCIWDSTIQSNWGNGVMNYIALKLKVGAQIHYGWLHIFIQYGLDSMNIPTISATVLEYGFNTIPNQPIRAGETNLTSNETNFGFEKNIFNVYPNPTGNEFFIENLTSEKLQFEIFDSAGKKVYSETVTGIKNKIDFSKYPVDVYTYRLTSGTKNIKSGKLIKQ